jgi:hypothetical protein
VERDAIENAGHRLRHRVAAALADRLSPERTRRATLLERTTVRRLSWDHVVLLNRWLAALGKLATAIWCAFIASVVLGWDVKDAVSTALNSGTPIENAFAFVILVPTLIFLVARSAIGFWRWRLQRELWRRGITDQGSRRSFCADRRCAETSTVAGLMSPPLALIV